jgi:F420-dependent oxidoreductase-like protein
MQGIRIGIALADGGGTPLDSLLARFRRAEEDGFRTVWVPNIFGFDALTLSALGGRETSSIEIGTAVVPTYSRHPLYMAQQALSTQAATGGRFVLGLGPSHQVVIENMLGLSYEKPARHVREYLQVVNDLLLKGRTEFKGETYQVNGSINVASGGPCPVLIGALGPVMRRVCGELADGTITWMTGPRTLGETLVPGIRAAAEAAGRPSPRVVCGLPIVLTDDPAGAKEAASKMFAMYGTLPSYRAMLDNEGVSDPGELAIAGDEKTIESAIRGLASAGVTDFNAAAYPYGPDAKGSLDRTQELLAQLARD